eukprot:scaffold284979_cov28-Tisochrysis_lutea.AAC.3
MQPTVGQRHSPDCNAIGSKLSAVGNRHPRGIRGDHATTDEEPPRPSWHVVRCVDVRAAGATPSGKRAVCVHRLRVSGQKPTALHGSGGSLENEAVHNLPAPPG